MAFPFKKILCPVDFDDNSLAALDIAAQLARHSDGTVFALHVVPMVIPPTGTPIYVDIYKDQEQAARDQLKEVSHKRLSAIKHELLVVVGEPANSILAAQRRSAADVIVMATHGRKGFSRVLLGSVAEIVLRDSMVPVLTVRYGTPDKRSVGSWMTSNPMAVSPAEKLSIIDTMMREGGFRSVPVVDEGKLVGIITDRDLARHVGYLDHTEAKMAMTEQVISVTPATPIEEAARLLRERKIGGLPVVENDRLVGVITTSDLLDAFVREHESKAG